MTRYVAAAVVMLTTLSCSMPPTSPDAVPPASADSLSVLALSGSEVSAFCKQFSDNNLRRLCGRLLREDCDTASGTAAKCDPLVAEWQTSAGYYPSFVRLYISRDTAVCATVQVVAGFCEGTLGDSSQLFFDSSGCGCTAILP
jgi:hypothetical protein